ncbi:MAG: tetratricopeptide repeat protein, partial [Bacteroidota bacterium]
ARMIVEDRAQKLVEASYGEGEMWDRLYREIPIFGNVNLSDEDLDQDPDQPLPEEMILWVWESNGEQDKPDLAAFANPAAPFSSVNAYLRGLRGIMFQAEWSKWLGQIKADFEQQRFGEALHLALQVREIGWKNFGEQDPSLWYLMTQLMPVFAEGGRHELDVPWLEKSIAEGDRESSQYPILLNNYAQHCTELGRFDDAATYFKKALDWFEQHPKAPVENMLPLRVMHNLGLALSRNAQYKEAIPYYEQAISLMKDSAFAEANQLLSLFQSNLSIALSEIGNVDQAISVQMQAIASRESFLEADHPYLANSYDILGNLFREKAKFAEAIEYLTKAADIRKVKLGPHHPDYTLSLANLAYAFAKQKQWTEAIELMQQAVENRIQQIELQYLFLPESQQLAFFRQFEMEILFFRGLAVRFANEKPALLSLLLRVQLIFRGLQIRGLHQLKQAVLAAKEEDAIAQMNEWLQAKNALAQIYTNPSLLAEKEQWEAQVAKLEKNLRQRFATMGSAPSWTQIQKKLKADEYWLEVFMYSPAEAEPETEGALRYAALVISSDLPEPQLLALQPEGVIVDADLQRAYRSAQQVKAEEADRNLFFNPLGDTETSIEDLYQILWARIATAVEGANLLYLLPDGIYYQINP